MLHRQPNSLDRDLFAAKNGKSDPIIQLATKPALDAEMIRRQVNKFFLELEAEIGEETGTTAR